MVIFISAVMNMKLFLKRDVAATDTNFSIFDESGNEKYRAAHIKTKVTKKLNMAVTDKRGEVVAKIRRLPIAGATAFVLKVGRTHITLVMVITRRGVLSYFYGNNWHIIGDLAKKNFSIIDVDKTVILNHRRQSGYAELEFYNAEHELYCVTASICANLINTVEKPVVKTANI